jgi:DNA polymerase III gamma/tau subunit
LTVSTGNKRTWCALSCIGLLASGTGCAAMRGRSASADPGARQVQASQEQSERAIEQAREAQKKASDQGRRAADAQQEVMELQQRLAQAQEKAKAEQEKARQLQEEANQATQRASAEARRSQQDASRALAQQSENVARGEQALSGQVLRATDDEIEVRPTGGGDTMRFRLTDRTRIEIGGRQASASDLMQGEDARVSYEVSGGTEPIAISVQVLRAEPRQPSQPSREDQPPSR